jgi:hypothetical protein
VKDFDINRIAWGLPDSPASNLCSYCFTLIREDDVPLRMWKENGCAAVFCKKCEGPAVEALLQLGQRRKP